MEDLIQSIRVYRLAKSLDERLRLADDIFRQVEPNLRFFVFGMISRPDAEDALQEVLKAIATGLSKFYGSTNAEFWAWSYRIARNKLNDQFRAKASNRTEAMSPEELWQLVETSAQVSAMSAADRLDLEYAMKLLAASKSECSDLLWMHYVLGLDYANIAEEMDLKYDNVRMKIGRCLDLAQSLIS